MSNDQDSVLAVANKEQQPTDAKQIIKDPMYLEFLGLKRESSYYERASERYIGVKNISDLI
jgi:predicted nuclease of restriction endonuclease-like (RecB) superfamily